MSNVFLHELRNAVRSIANRPAFSALVVGVLGAGLACVIFMLTLLNGFVLRPLPFAHPDELLQAGFRDADSGLGNVAPVNSQDLLGIQRHLAATADAAGIARLAVNLSDLDAAQHYNGAYASTNLFRVLGVAPMLGRDFSVGDERSGAPPVAMLSYTLWQDRYHGDPSIVGRQIRVNSRPATVIGVMPENFSYPRREVVWLPTTLREGDKADGRSYWVVLRRHAGVGDAAVIAALETWFADAAHADPARFRNQQPQIEPLAEMSADRPTRNMLPVLFAAVSMVLLIACANAANLLLTRTLGRSRELALRVALGASRQHLIARVLAESLLLSLIALAVALLLAHVGVRWQIAMMRQSEYFPQWLRFDIDTTLVLFVFGAALFTAIIAGILPALRAGDMAVASRLGEGASGSGDGAFARMSRILVIGEVALSCALLVCVGTLVRGFRTLDHADLGINTGHLLSARVALFTNTYPTAADQLRLYERLADRLRADPDVVDASVGSVLPGTYFNRAYDLLPSGVVPGDGELPNVFAAATDAHFPGAYGARLEQGRFFDSRDHADSERVAVVDRNFATRFGGAEPVLGRRFRLDPRDPDGATVTVVGVIGALTLDTTGIAGQPALLMPLSQNVFRIASVAVRTRGAALDFAPRLNAIMHEVDADTPLYWVRDYPAVIASMTVGERSFAKSFGIFGIVALGLATAGLYGVMAFGVDRRTREIGVRRALGAQGRQVLRDVFGRSLLQLGMGLVLGVAAGIAFVRLLSASLLDSPSLRIIASADPLAVLVALGVLVAAAVLATLIPARRALRVDPMVSLRHE